MNTEIYYPVEKMTKAEYGDCEMVPAVPGNRVPEVRYKLRKCGMWES